MAKTKNKHGRKGVKPGKATPREVPGTKDDLYARLASAEGDIDHLKGQIAAWEFSFQAVECSLQEIVNVCATTRAGAGKQARMIAQATLDGLQA